MCIWIINTVRGGVKRKRLVLLCDVVPLKSDQGMASWWDIVLKDYIWSHWNRQISCEALRRLNLVSERIGRFCCYDHNFQHDKKKKQLCRVENQERGEASAISTVIWKYLWAKSIGWREKRLVFCARHRFSGFRTWGRRKRRKEGGNFNAKVPCEWQWRSSGAVQKQERVWDLLSTQMCAGRRRHAERFEEQGRALTPSGKAEVDPAEGSEAQWQAVG